MTYLLLQYISLSIERIVYILFAPSMDCSYFILQLRFPCEEAVPLMDLLFSHGIEIRHIQGLGQIHV